MDERQVVRIAKAVSDPTRLRMLREIAAVGEISCGELGRRFPISQPTVSHHLKVLEDAGLIRTRRDGQFHYVRAVRGVLVEFSRSLEGGLAAAPLTARAGRRARSASAGRASAGI